MLSPWTEVETAFAEMDALAQALLGRGMDGRHGLRQLVYRPDAPELVEDEDGWRITADVPGLTADALELTVDNGVLALSASRALAEAGDAQIVRHRERRGWSLDRRWRLPDVVDLDGIEAHLTDGVLTVTLPKRPETRPRRIAVQG